MSMLMLEKNTTLLAFRIFKVELHRDTENRVKTKEYNSEFDI